MDYVKLVRVEAEYICDQPSVWESTWRYVSSSSILSVNIRFRQASYVIPAFFISYKRIRDLHFRVYYNS